MTCVWCGVSPCSEWCCLFFFWQAGWDCEEPVQVPDVQEEVQARREAAHRLLRREGELGQVVGFRALGLLL